MSFDSLPAIISEQTLKFLPRLSNDTKCILHRPSELFQLLCDTLHRQCIRKEQQLPRPLHITIPYHIQLPYRIDLCIVSNLTIQRTAGLTSLSRLASAGGKYGGRGIFSVNVDANVEKNKMMLPTISYRSLFTGTIKSCRTLVYHSSRVVTQRILCSWSMIRCRLVSTPR